jgi:hypothetical protein
VRITADKPKSISFYGSLRGVRNHKHISNYATDYFKMDPDGNDGRGTYRKVGRLLWALQGKLKYDGQSKSHIREARTIKNKRPLTW